MRRLVVLTALLCAMGAPAFTQVNGTAARHSVEKTSAGTAELSAKVDEAMNSLIPAGGPGAAVIVIKDGQIIHKKGYGLANVDAKVPIAPDTLFDLASVSKQFTAMAIMILAERGKLSYDDPLTKFFPEFPEYAQKITVRHLLHHTSGLPDYMGAFQRAGKKDWEPTSADVIKLLAGEKEPRFTPGDKWEYSNSGYVVLGQVAEKASGVRLPEFLKKNVFEPLGMTATLISDETRPKFKNRAISYAPDGETYKNIDYTPLNLIYGDGNVNTTVEDLFKWDQALYTEKLVKQSTIRQAFTPGKLNSGQGTTYGFGWILGKEGSLERVGHSGSWVGFRTYIARYPSERFTFAVLSNFARFKPGQAADRIAKIYLGDKLPSQAAIKVPVEVLSRYVGKYELRPGFILEITLNNGELSGQATGQSKARLVAESETKFFLAEVPEIRITFNKDASGAVIGLTLHQNGDHPAKRLAQ